jgi:hypothetical protein
VKSALLPPKSAFSPLVLLALGAGLLGAVARIAPRPEGLAARLPPGEGPKYEVPCPPGQLPDEGICIPVTAPGELLVAPAGAPPADLVPLRAGRPVEFERYRWPLEPESGARASGAPVSGASPSGAPVSGASLTIQEEITSDLGPALRISSPGGATVQSLALEGQEGPTEVVFASHGPPAWVVTAHRVTRERGRLTLLLVHSDLAEVEKALLEAMPTAPLQLQEGQRLGRAAPSGILLALRQLRRDVKLSDAVPDLAPDAVFPSDPRNALPLTAPPLTR